MLPLIKLHHSLSVEGSHLDSVAELVGDMSDLLQRITNVDVALDPFVVPSDGNVTSWQLFVYMLPP